MLIYYSQSLASVQHAAPLGLQQVSEQYVWLLAVCARQGLQEDCNVPSEGPGEVYVGRHATVYLAICVKKKTYTRPKQETAKRGGNESRHYRCLERARASPAPDCTHYLHSEKCPTRFGTETYSLF